MEIIHNFWNQYNSLFFVKGVPPPLPHEGAKVGLRRSTRSIARLDFFRTPVAGVFSHLLSKALVST